MQDNLLSRPQVHKMAVFASLRSIDLRPAVDRIPDDAAHVSYRPPGIGGMPMRGTRPKPKPGGYMIRRADRQRFLILKYQAKIADAGLKANHLRRCVNLELQRIPRLVNEMQLVNEWRAAQVTFYARFDADKTFREFYEQGRLVEVFIHQQPRAAVAERDARNVNFVLKKIQQRRIQLALSKTIQFQRLEGEVGRGRTPAFETFAYPTIL